MDTSLIDTTAAACTAEIQKRASATAEQGLRLQGAADGVAFLAQELKAAAEKAAKGATDAVEAAAATSPAATPSA